MLIAPPRVLLVEDAPAIREALQTALGGAGYVVSSQTDGGGLVEAVIAFRPDLLLLDVMLQGTDGFSLAAALAVG